MSSKNWEHFFKPEVRSSGNKLLPKVSLSKPSDTEVQAYIGALKAWLKTGSIASALLTADCSCPSSKKGHLCKHIWAILLATEEKYPDFLDDKTELQKKSSETILKPKISQTQSDSQSAYKLKQAEYRKEQYQIQKQRMKDRKKTKKEEPESRLYPPIIELALKFFLDNGFPLRDDMTRESVGIAKKKLSRVFHPDVGGSHDEILDLNKFAEILAKFSQS